MTFYVISKLIYRVVRFHTHYLVFNTYLTHTLVLPFAVSQIIGYNMLHKCALKNLSIPEMFSVLSHAAVLGS